MWRNLVGGLLAHLALASVPASPSPSVAVAFISGRAGLHDGRSPSFATTEKARQRKMRRRPLAASSRSPSSTWLHVDGLGPSNDIESSFEEKTTIANHTFRLPSDDHLETIQERQLFHPLQPSQVFCVSSNPCRHGHPQAFGFHPTNGPKLVSGLFRLSCPLLCEAIDDYEGEGGVRQMSDWIRRDDRSMDAGVKREGYERANEAQKHIRMELAKDDEDKLVERMGEYNAQRFLESGVAGIPPGQTYNVKCVHAHVADHLCRCPSSSSSAASGDEVEGNIIGRETLRILEERGVQISGNDVCWQQCSKDNERLPSDWKYVPRKNRQKLRTTRERRKDIREGKVEL